jgi:tRNA-specific adenosine deaminase 1
MSGDDAPSAKRLRGASPSAAALDVDASWAPPAGAGRDWGAEVAAASLRAYDALPRTGKPAADGREWVLAAAFLVTPGGNAPPRVVALGTGTKCLTASQRSAAGDVVNDCHAEVVARRALHLWLYAQLQRAADGKQHDDCYFTRAAEAGKFALRPGVALHMYVSGSPCGDASILAGGDEAAATLRTGAKLVGDVPLPCGSWREAGGAAQAEGAARRKPGRGEATLSMSCSDKMARWGALGVQGALLARFLTEPLRLASLTVASATCAAHLAAAQRAFDGRLAAPAAALAGTAWAMRPPALFAAPLPHAQLQLPSASAAQASPCGFSINWLLDGGAAEVLLGTTGRHAGATRATLASPKTRSRLCRAALLQRFLHLSALAGAEPSPAEVTYAALKRSAPDGYAEARAALLAEPCPLAAWIPKPQGELDFCAAPSV